MSWENELLLFHVYCYQCVYSGVYFVHCYCLRFTVYIGSVRLTGRVSVESVWGICVLRVIPGTGV